MSTPWYVVKYMPDLYRREPRNVGVVLLDDAGGLVRFFGQDPDTGEVNTSHASVMVPETRAYRQWVHYFSHHAGQGTWPRVLESLQRRSFDNFYIEEGGRFERDYDDPHAALEDLFRSLVADVSVPARDTTRVKELRGLVKRVFELAHLEDRIERQPEYDLEIEGPRSRTRTKVRFDYRFVNGATTLMERMPLTLNAPQLNSERVDALLYRIEQVLKGGADEKFIAFYHVPERATEAEQSTLEPHIRHLETHADALEVGDVSFAARNLRQRLGFE